MPDGQLARRGREEVVAVDPDRMTFEELVAELESLTGRLGSGDIGIEEAADLYEQAERLHALARERLERVQARIDAVTTRAPGAGDPAER